MGCAEGRGGVHHTGQQQDDMRYSAVCVQAIQSVEIKEPTASIAICCPTAAGQDVHPWSGQAHHCCGCDV